MQLGSRWQAGHAPHPGVPASLHEAIAAAELGLGRGSGPESGSAPGAAAGASWTLTWLEGRPRVELVDGTGTLRADLSLAADGSVVAKRLGSPEASGLGTAGAGNSAAGGTESTDGTDGTDGTDDEDDDDDWLS